MKKIKVSMVALVLGCTILLSSCIGSFGLFNNVLSWNKELSGSKFVNEVVFLGLCIVPVYEICYFADAVVFNSIEFWTGNNPVAASGEVKQVKGENDTFAITTNENGYSITSEVNGTIDFVFDKNDNSWNVCMNGESFKLMTINDNNTIDLYLQNGETMNLLMDETGLMAARQVVFGNCFAQR